MLNIRNENIEKLNLKKWFLKTNMKLQEVSESWNEFSSIYNEISEFLNLPKRDVEKHHLSEVQNPAQCQVSAHMLMCPDVMFANKELT